MAQADSVYITPPTNTSAIDHPMMLPPRVPTPQERADELLQRWRLARGPANCRIANPAGAVMSPLTPEDVLVDLLGSGDFPAEVLDPEAAAWIILRRLFDAGFEVVDRADRTG